MECGPRVNHGTLVWQRSCFFRIDDPKTSCLVYSIWEIHQKRVILSCDVSIRIPTSIGDIIRSRLVNVYHVPDSTAGAGVPGEEGSVATRKSWQSTLVALNPPACYNHLGVHYVCWGLGPLPDQLNQNLWFYGQGLTHPYIFKPQVLGSQSWNPLVS